MNFNFDIQGTGDFDDITGSSEGEIITGTSGPDLITGGSDELVYDKLGDGGDIITNFIPGEEKSDFSSVMDMAQIGYMGSTPVEDGYIDFVEWNDDTIVRIDVDGLGTRARPRGYILMKNLRPQALSNAIITASGT